MISENEASSTNANTGDSTKQIINLDKAEFYRNRELSLLDFNQRVLAQANDPSIPLLERLFFLTISSSNLDEFFEIRVAGVKQQIALGISNARPDKSTPLLTLQALSKQAHKLVADQYTCLNEEIIPALNASGIRLHNLRTGDRIGRTLS